MQYLMTGTKSGTPLTTKTNTTSFTTRASSIPSLTSQYAYQPSPTYSMNLTQPGLQTPPLFANSQPSATPYTGLQMPVYNAPNPYGSPVVGTNNPFASVGGATPFGTAPRSPGANNPFATNPNAAFGAGPQQQVRPPVTSVGISPNNPFATNPALKSANNPFASLNSSQPGSSVAPAPVAFGTYGPPLIPTPSSELSKKGVEEPSSSSEESLPAPPTAYGAPLIAVPPPTSSTGGLPARSMGTNNAANPFLKM